MKKQAVILLSGGLDSATVAAQALADGYELHALSFSYGQRHCVELEYAKKLAVHFNIKDRRIAEIDLSIFQGSALTSDIEVPKNRQLSDKKDNDIPVTYVPARNTIFLSYALAFAESIGAFDIFIGVNALDYSGYPDCRPDYIASFEKMANLATKAGVEGSRRFQIHTPLINMTKEEIITTGIELGVDYSMTISCYDPKDEKPCGECDSCQLRRRGFEEAGYDDHS